MKETTEFVLALKNASLDDPLAKLSDDAPHRLRNPPQEPIITNSPGVRQSISMYLALEHGSQEVYNRMRRAKMRNFEGANGVDEILSFYNVEKLISQHIGVESIEHDMCPESCLAFTGPFAHLESCPMCGSSRWDQAKLRASSGKIKVAAQTFVTIPLGLQLQALYRDPESARHMRYLWERTQEVLDGLRQTGKVPVVDDIAIGFDILGAVLDGEIKQDDIVLMVSLDGAQLYESKTSDCWIYIWVILNLSPDKRYQKLHVHPGGFIPEPNKPKKHLHLIFTTADVPGLVYWDGMVGHSGKNGCRMHCGVRGRRKTRGTHYYPALLKLRNRCVEGSDHADIDVFPIPLGVADDYAKNLELIVTAPSQRQYELKKTDTGLTKPPLILGLSPQHCLGVPLRNLSDLLLALWYGTMDCAPTDNGNTWDWAVLCDGDGWISHGKAVEAAGPYFPGSFDRKPRNIAEKINTDYKTWEFHLYTFGLGPALLYNILPEPYWLNYCKLHSLTAEELTDAFILLGTWKREFETLYYQLREDRLHFTSHLVTETVQKGPPIRYAQWTMERTIGNLDTATDLGNGYALLRKRDRYAKLPVGEEAQALSDFLGPNHPLPRVKKWSRLLSPNGQIARSAWREKLMPLDKTRMSRHVKPSINRQTQFAEVLYYTRLAFAEPDVDDSDDEAGYHFLNVAVIQMYSSPDDQLLRLSSQTVVSCSLLDEISVIDVKKIISVVAMIPHKPRLPSGIIEDRFFMLEKPELDIANFGASHKNLGDDAEDDEDADIE
ncbi:hypothetical protein DFJ58DRAFT_719384 [Suillus subalutaceus]|uniref:uncharacterized protein n=1 Tax=Suillus subalutaceus TaxID=48586 RepID=UPI001B885038|nr:uncharacterized protein DFJ58DRAFT_719384 [Suillus subalutaceus]KAG1834015.1 hypothetical protein DFJ58DRAFT_719384 [Suillus subalutaceus]